MADPPRPDPLPPEPPRADFRPTASELPPLADPPPSEPPRVAPLPEVPAPVTGSAAPITDERFQLPVHKGKLARVQDHAEGIANSITDWIELRIALTKREVKDQIDALKAQLTELLKAYGLAAGAGLVAALAAFFMGGFLFTALFSIWLSLSASLFLGWLLYTILFAIAALVLFKRAEKKKEELPLFRDDRPLTADRPHHDVPSESDRVARDREATNAPGLDGTGA